MNGEIPSVPITTLAGISSLTDLLPELPLPSPLPHTVNNKSLLFHPNIAEQAKAILGTKNEAIVSQLVTALSQTNTEDIELNDNLAGDAIEGDVPQLLRAILAQDPCVFKGGAAYNSANNTGNGSNSAHGSNHPVNQSGDYQSLPSAASTSRFQDQFASFTQQATVNGGSPSGYCPVSTHKSVHGSPAQATAAPLTGDPIDQASMTEDRHQNRRKSQGSSEPVVLLQPLSDEAIGEATKRAASLPRYITKNSPEKSNKDGKDMVPVISLKRVDDSGGSKDKKKQRREDKPVYNVSSSETGARLTLKLTKAKIPEEKKEDKREEKRPSKRRRSSSADDVDDDDYEPPDDPDDDYTPSLSERVKRRRRQTGASQYADGDGSDDAPDSPGYKPPKKDVSKSSREKSKEAPSGPSSPAEEKKRRKEVRHKRRLPEVVSSVEELMETPTFKRFSSAIDTVLECAEDVDLSELKDDDDDAGNSSEALVSRALLSELCGEAAKLKAMGVTHKVPTEKLIKVLTILQYNIRDGYKVIVEVKDQDEDTVDPYYREIALEKVTTAVDAALIALYIMTSPNMPKEVFIEDVIDRIVKVSRSLTQNTIYPEFDPVYRVDPKSTTGYTGGNKSKRARAGGVKNKAVINVYNKLTDLIGTLAELIDVQELTDTVILQLSTVAVSPFFVENISELQLSALKLVTSIFSRYDKHRQLIMEDILSSLARLPTSKKNLRNYRLNSEDQIQMVTALALQLIQCVVKLPQIEPERPSSPKPAESSKKKKENKTRSKTETKKKELVKESTEIEAVSTTGLVDNEVIIVTSIETAMRTAHNFLSVFLKKCTIKGDEDYRPLFEHFVYDLLATVNKPEWPAAELLLNLLGRLLVTQFSNKSIDMSQRVASLDYLGIVAARLRKDAVNSQLNEETLNEIIEQINEDGEEQSNPKDKKSKVSDLDRTQSLYKALLEYLVYNAQNDPALLFSRQFYIAMWYRDSASEIERSQQKTQKTTPEKGKDKKKTPKKSTSRRRSSRRRGSSSSEEESSESSSEESEEEPDEEKQKKMDLAKEVERQKEIQELAEKRKDFLLTQIGSKMEAFATFKPSPSKLDYENSCLVTRYLSSNRHLSQSFDIYLAQILKVLCETAVAVRTKAMKCLTAVVEADPSILSRADMQSAVHARLLDQSTSVREAAVELLGKFILIRPELTSQYYDMLSDRILDTGISVRKRVIKIFRDICLEQTEFNKIPEMCVKMIRRVNDEEGIKKLVNETFQSMWFNPFRDRDSGKLLTRVMNITDVVLACKDTGYDWFEQLLENLLKKEESASSKPVEKACSQIIDCLVEKVLRLEEMSAEGGSHAVTPRLLACFSTLYLFCKVKPELLVPHSTKIQPYMGIKCNMTPHDHLVPHNVARILEEAVPLMDHPSESFLATLEEDMMRLIFRNGMTVLQSSVSCLGAVVNKVSHNYTLVRDCFQKFFGILSRVKAGREKDPSGPPAATRPTLLRSLFSVGLLCKHFDFDSQDFGEKRVSVKDKVFDVLMYFITHEDEDVKMKALAGVGFFAVRHYEYMMGTEIKELYQLLLTDPDQSNRMCCQVLKNIQNYLLEEEQNMMKADAEWRKLATKEDLKEMGDVQSGMASTIIQVYLKQVLESFFHSQSAVRLQALNVITLILRQGLVHPVQCVPYLISMGSDFDPNIRIKADQQLAEIDKKYPGFIQMKALHGVKMSYRLQELLQPDPLEPVRGIRVEENNVIALSSYIYSLIRSNRGQRRALLSNILNMFDDTAKTPIKELVYMADNLSHYPYQYQDEPLFIIHQIDIIVSVSGSNLIQSFREIFYPEASEKPKFDEDEDDDVDKLIELLPEDLRPLQDCFLASQGCVLLLVLKQHLKEQYGFTDNKIQRYSPSEPSKVYDKPLTRKHGVKFCPKQAIDLLKEGPLPTEIDEEGKAALVQSYLAFKQLMLSIDPDDEDEDLPPKPAGVPGTENQAKPGEQAGGIPLENGETDGAPTTTPHTQPAASDNKENNTECAIVQVTPARRSHHHHHHGSSSSSSRSHHQSSSSSSSSAYRLSINNLLEKKRSSTSSTPHKSRSSGTPSSSASASKHRPKKKKRRRRRSDSEEDSDDDDSDPDFVV